MTDWPAIWSAIYEQVNAHYREIAKKRDQVIAFYLVLLAGLVGSWDKLRDYRESILTFVWLVGIACVWLAIQYWRWHTVHTSCMVVVQRLMSASAAPTIERCEALWRIVNDERPVTWRTLLPKGAETTILYLLSIMTFIPAYLLGRGTPFLPVHVASDFVAIALDVIPYSAAIVLLGSLYVRQFHDFNANDWPFRWLRGITSDDSSLPRASTFE